IRGAYRSIGLARSAPAHSLTMPWTGWEQFGASKSRVEHAPRLFTRLWSGLLPGSSARPLPGGLVRGWPVCLPRFGFFLLSALSPGAGGVGRRPLAALEPRSERRRALAGQPDGRRPLSAQSRVCLAAVRLVGSMLRDRAYVHRLFRAAGPGPVMRGELGRRVP